MPNADVNTTPSANEDATAPQVSRVAVKPPPFWKPDPKLWFLQVEAQFMRAGITTDDSKYYTLVAEIDSSILKCASDIISTPPIAGKYETLKARLIDEFSESDDYRFKRLFDNLAIEGKKPSGLLREIKDLSGNKLDPEILKSLWLRQLPTQVQQILATVEGDVNVLAKKADCMTEIQYQPKVSLVDESGNMHKAIAELTKRFDRLEQGRGYHTPDRQQRSPRRRGSSHPRSSRSPSNEICWYHRTFKERATKCRSPCSFRPRPSENL
ncbi:uncharacterized protein LOC135961422 [Calliphora vicina]|uniref:uncharacterized protein LOC135961422 n=1 Tax=Calliphora vicina TaxID=7373 RepID=UPI00325C2820